MATSEEFLVGNRRGRMSATEERLTSTLVPTPARAPHAPVDWPKLTPHLDVIVVRPMDSPTHSAGGIELPAQVIAANRALCCVGQIMQMGSLTYTAVTRDGVHYADEKRKAMEGDWVFFKKGAGMPMPIKHPTARSAAYAPRQLLMMENDILAIFENSTDASKVWSWVQ